MQDKLHTGQYFHAPSYITRTHYAQAYYHPRTTLPHQCCQLLCQRMAVRHLPYHVHHSRTRGISKIIGYKDYYLENERILCTCVFSIAAIATSINNGAPPPGITKLDDNMGHNCKMSQALYKSCSLMFLGLVHDPWATACTKCTFQNLILQDIGALRYYYYDTNIHINS